MYQLAFAVNESILDSFGYKEHNTYISSRKRGFLYVNTRMGTETLLGVSLLGPTLFLLGCSLLNASFSELQMGPSDSTSMNTTIRFYRNKKWLRNFKWVFYTHALI